MTRIAVSGHRELPKPTERLVDAALRAEIAKHADDELVGLSCIADGADAIFARAVLDNGGSLTVVVPAKHYRAGLPVNHHRTYDELLGLAGKVIQLDHSESNSQAHMDASVRMLDEADELIAVWDGKPTRSHGGTADVVKVARERGLPVTVVWPEGATRD